MYAFGHVSFSLYVFYKITKDIKKSVFLSFFSFLPDIDLLIGLTHRGITHSLLFIPAYIPIIYLASKIFGIKLNFKEIVLFSVILHFLHIIADIACGYVEILPGIWVGTSCQLDSIKDCIFGIIFYFLFFLKISKFSTS